MEKLNHITVTEMLKFFMIHGCRKWRNRVKIETFVVLAEYLQQHPDCIRYKRKTSKSKRSSSWRNQSYLPFLSNKWKPYHGAINIRPSNLRTTLERYFRFHQLQATSCWSEKQYAKFWDLFPTFLWRYSYNLENIFTAWF